ncbi:MAG TPA: hypothetical protein VGB71_08995 [Flavisolibacter sp.]
MRKTVEYRNIRLKVYDASRRKADCTGICKKYFSCLKPINMKYLLALLLIVFLSSCKQQSVPLHTPYLQQRAAQEEKLRIEKQLSMINQSGQAEKKRSL